MLTKITLPARTSADTQKSLSDLQVGATTLFPGGDGLNQFRLDVEAYEEFKLGYGR